MNNHWLENLILNPKFNKQMNWEKLYPEFFTYVVDSPTSLASGASQTVNLQVQADASFYLTTMMGTLFTANTQSASFGTQQIVNATIQMFDSGAGKNLFSAPVQFSHLFGQGGFDPFELPGGRLIQNNSSLSFTITNNSGAAITEWHISLIGCKLLNRG